MLVKLKPEYIFETLKVNDEFETLKVNDEYEINRLGTIRRIKDGFRPSITKAYDTKSKRPSHCCIGLNGKIYKYHRLIAIQFIDNPENLPQVDHININPFDNRIENLRWVNARTNANNKSKHSTNHNINWHSIRNVWEVRIFIANKKLYFGSFKTDEYDSAIKRRNQMLYFYGFPIPD